MADARGHPTATLFGGFAWIDPGGPPLHPPGERPLALLAYLLLHRDAPVPRAYLAALLWPDSPEGQARTNLRNLLHTLRRTLPGTEPYLDASATTLRWRAEVPLDLDVAAFEVALAAAAAAPGHEARVRHLEVALARYRGDLLEGQYDPWLDAPRAGYRARWRDALRDLAATHAALGDHEAARRIAEERTRSDPLDEDAAIDLMRHCATLGDRVGVRRAFGAHAEALAEELGADPGPAARVALAAASSAASEAAPERGARAPRPLPTRATPFLGRRAELAQVTDRLADPECRLLTLVGPGGFGKTRLALAVAGRLAEREPHAVAWVDLAPARTPDQAATAIAESLRLRLRGSANPLAEVAQALERRRLLLVLDEAEHLADAAPMLAQLLASTTSLRLLVTSRHALGLPEAWRLEVGALPVPDDEADVDLAANDAVRLFLQAARRVAGPRPGEDVDLSDVADVCRTVGGVPLAVELAASWTRLLTPAEVVAELARGPELLEHAAGGDRRRSLRAVFDQSWALLDDPARGVLRRLAVFEAGFTREAAARVAGAELPHLAALVDRSLLQRAAPARYQLHPLVRQFAAERLSDDADDADATRERHAAFTLGWLAGQTTPLTSARQNEALAAIAGEAADVRAAWAWAVGHGCTDLLDDAAFALFYALELRGSLHESVRAFDAAARAPATRAPGVEAGDPDPRRRRSAAAAHAFAGFAAFRLGRLADAEARLGTAVASLADLDPARPHAERHLGLLHWARGAFDDASAHMRASRDGFARRDDRWGVAMAEAYLGMIDVDRGDLEGAPARLEPALAEALAVGDPRLVANVRLILGRARLLLGQGAGAEAQLRACLLAAQDPNSVGYATLYLGAARQAQGDRSEARALLGRAVAHFAAAGDAVGRERSLLALGFLDLEEGDTGSARSRFRAAFEAGDRVHGTRYLLAAVVGTAAVHARTGDPADARAWLDAVLRHPGLDVESRLRAEALRATVPGAAEPLAFDAVIAAVRRALDG